MKGNLSIATADTHSSRHLKSVDFHACAFGLFLFCGYPVQDKDSKEEKSIEELIKEYEDDGED